MDWEVRGEKIQGILSAIGRLAVTSGNREEAQRVKDALQKIKQERCVVVVCGEFKRGKSSLLNAYLEQGDLCPVNADIATNLVTKISYAETTSVTVHYDESEEGKQEQIPVGRIAEYVTEQGNENNNKDVVWVDVKVPIEKLKAGTIFYDTPGVGGLNKKHAEATYRILPQADCVIFVSDATVPLSEPELRFIKLVLVQCPNLLFVMTRIDLVSDYKSVMENNREKLAEVLGKSKEQVEIIPVSNRMKNSYMKTQDPEDLEDSNYPELESKLNEILMNKRVRLVQMAGIARGLSVLQDLGQAWKTEWATYKSGNGEQVQRLAEEYKKSRERLAEVRQGSSSFHTMLVDGQQDIAREAAAIFDQGFLKLDNSVRNQFVKDEELIKAPAELEALLKTHVQFIANDINSLIQNGFGKLHQRLIECSGLNMPLSGVGEMNWNGHSNDMPDFQPKTTTKGNKIWRTLQQGYLGISLGATIGKVVGGVVGGAFGGPPGAIIGASLGAVAGGLAAGKETWRDIDEKKRQTSVAELIQSANSWLIQAKHELRTKMNEIVTQSHRNLRDVLKEEIERQIRQCEEMIARIEEKKVLSQQEMEKKRESLRKLLVEHARLEKDLKKLAEEFD